MISIGADAIQAISTMTLIMLLFSLAGQVQHGYLRVMHSNPRVRTMAIVYECAILVHLMLMAAHNAHSAHAGIDPVVDSGVFAYGLWDMALWINFAVSAVTAYTSLADMRDSGEPDATRWLPPFETALVFCCTPPALALFGEMRFVPLVVDAIYFFARTGAFILLDSSSSRKIVSPLSIADALRRLPEGILYADQTGRVIMANDAMRHCLAALGVEGPPAKISDIWSQLNEKNRSEHEANVPQEYMSKPGVWLILRIGEDEVRLFSLENVDLSVRQTSASSNVSSPTMLTPTKAARAAFGNAPATRIIAYDVTEEMKILDEIEETNASLTILQRDLESSIEGVREAAENEALLRMRRRVHDVIGQRLSMLHRSLEGNEISNEKIEQLKPLLSSILEDLSTDTSMSPEDEVNATIAAFALANVEINLQGQLPDNAQHAKVYADAIRETTTNAVRHGGAEHVDAIMGEGFIEISNDGLPAYEPATEGIGLSSIRHAVEAAGGTLTVTNKPFSVRIEFPNA